LCNLGTHFQIFEYIGANCPRPFITLIFVFLNSQSYFKSYLLQHRYNWIESKFDDSMIEDFTEVIVN
jgi:hypothetical protein